MSATSRAPLGHKTVLRSAERVMEGAFDVQDEKNRRDEGERKEKLVLFFCVLKDIFKSFSVHKILSLFF